MKTKVLLVIFLAAINVSVHAQSITGRYVTDDEDSLYQYFEFSGSTVRFGMELMGYTQRLSASYEIDGDTIYITVQGYVIELEVEDNNTLIGVGFGMDDVVFKKKK